MVDLFGSGPFVVDNPYFNWLSFFYVGADPIDMVPSGVGFDKFYSSLSYIVVGRSAEGHAVLNSSIVVYPEVSHI